MQMALFQLYGRSVRQDLVWHICSSSGAHWLMRIVSTSLNGSDPKCLPEATDTTSAMAKLHGKQELESIVPVHHGTLQRQAAIGQGTQSQDACLPEALIKMRRAECQAVADGG